jgi:hypothetical protein
MVMAHNETVDDGDHHKSTGTGQAITAAQSRVST